MAATLEQFLAVAFSTPLGRPDEKPGRGTIRGIPTNVVGLSGVGKSERIFAAARAIGLTCWPVYAATKAPEDFTGVAVPTPTGVLLECILPAARNAIEQGSGVIFLDEITCARPSVQAALLSFVNDRKVGDHQLPPGVRIVLASNPPEYAAGGFGLEAPMANRMAHVEYTVPSAGEWANWLLGREQEPLPTIADAEQLVDSHWDDVWPTVQGLGAGFIESNPKLLHQQPQPDEDESGGAWPSHRMWFLLLRATATIRCLPEEIAPASLEYEFAKALVGKGPAKVWRTYLKNMDLPHPRDMLANGWRVNPKRLDQAFVSLAALTSYVQRRPDSVRFSEAVQAWSILEGVVTDGRPDLVISSVLDLIGAKLAREGTPTPLVEASKRVVGELTKQGYHQFI